MIEVVREPNRYNFIGNAIVFEFVSDSPDVIDVEIVSAGESRLASYYPFRSGEKYKVKAEISGYLYSESTAIGIPEGQMISLLPDFSLPYSVKIGDEYAFEGIAFEGGISNEAMKLLSENGYDIFTYRLASPFDQFLFTTRTHSTEIRIKKTELHPFTFIHPGIGIVFRSISGNTVSPAAFDEGVICVMDMDAVRNEFEQLCGEVPIYIEVLVGGEISFHFTIIEGQVSEEKYLIRFRNSLGAYEKIEVTGHATHAPELSDENVYEILTNFDFFEERRNRVSARGTIEVETGYKSRQEMPFVLDMIKSDEIYFIYPDGYTFRCHVTSDSIKYLHRMIAPTSIPLIIREITDEQFNTPDIDIDQMNTVVVFDDSFDDTFE